MFAIIEFKGFQYKVEPNKTYFVSRLNNEIGDEIIIDRVLLIAEDKGNVKIGKPVVEGAQVKAKVVNHVKGDKIIVFKKKRRKGYRVKKGHRQQYTQIAIESITY